ncbi:hypothetical protein GW17_00017842 [Ensete ventricosum]|nr:hypothetical protein GW17_00017842 [Ensete ventricosum]
MVYITVGSAAHPILEFLEEWSTENFESTKIFVNGCWVGIHRNPDLLVKTLRQLRRQVWNLCLDATCINVCSLCSFAWSVIIFFSIIFYDRKVIYGSLKLFRRKPMSQRSYHIFLLKLLLVN